VNRPLSKAFTYVWLPNSIAMEPVISSICFTFHQPPGAELLSN
jgi:hypothetical protein